MYQYIILPFKQPSTSLQWENPGSTWLPSQVRPWHRVEANKRNSKPYNPIAQRDSKISFSLSLAVSKPGVSLSQLKLTPSSLKQGNLPCCRHQNQTLNDKYLWLWSRIPLMKAILRKGDIYAMGLLVYKMCCSSHYP